MNYEQKYKEALKVIESLYNVVRYQSSSDALLASQTIEKAFPELKESEDERIRKALITYIKHNVSVILGWGKDELIAWLEKQGEQKLIDKNESKFEIGDWITFYGGEPFQILKVEEESNGCLDYLLLQPNGKDSYFNKKYVDENARLWTVQDAISQLKKLKEQKQEVKLIFPKFRVGDRIFKTHNSDINKCGIFTITKITEQGYWYNDSVICAINEEDEWELEKQGEQKSADKVEPKFKVGDWIVKQYLSYPFVIVDIKNDSYILNDIEGNKYEETIDFANRVFYLWTIEDAKDGDVLEFGDHGRPVVGIVSFINKNTGKVDVACLLEDNKFKLGNFYALDTIKPHPATKEQRDILFQKMKESGYELDTEKKELRKIEQKTAWSEEDERHRKRIVQRLEDIRKSKEDNIDVASVILSEINWLKSIKPRWKPTEEQMQALFEAKLASTKNREYFLGLLYEDLKKL